MIIQFCCFIYLRSYDLVVPCKIAPMAGFFTAAPVKFIIHNGRRTMVKVDITDEQAAAVAAYVESSVKGK